MRRRTALTAVGASILGGAAPTSGAAADDADGGPRIVDVSSDVEPGSRDDDDWYTVEYGDGGTVVVTGATTVPEPCFRATVVGIESTPYGDVVRLEQRRADDVCPQAVSRLSFRIELEYPDEADDVFLEIVDSGGWW